MGAPYFSNETETRVLVSRGQTCYLHCLVGNLGDRQVRLTDFGIISAFLHFGFVVGDVKVKVRSSSHWLIS